MGFKVVKWIGGVPSEGDDDDWAPARRQTMEASDETDAVGEDSAATTVAAEEAPVQAQAQDEAQDQGEDEDEDEDYDDEDEDDKWSSFDDYY